MKINEINNLDLNTVSLKLSDNSITVKQDNKTKAVINDIALVSKLPFNKKVELNTKFGSKLNSYFDKLYIGLDKSLHYFIDCASVKMANMYPDEANKLQNKTELLTSLNVNIYYINLA